MHLAAWLMVQYAGLFRSIQLHILQSYMLLL